MTTTPTPDDLAITQVPFDDLEFWPGNARRGVVSDIAESMRINGVFNAVVVQQSTNRVMVGNHRLMALMELHKEDPETWPATAPAVILDVDDQQAARINLADNKTADDATWDQRLLAEQLTALMEEDGLAGTGFDEDELEELVSSLEASDRALEGEDGLAADEQDVEPPEDPISELGDIWVLGRHRVICGDSTDPEVYKALLEDEPADVIWTDPPYGVSYVGGTKDKLTIQNDGAEGLAELLGAAFPAMVAATRAGAPVYVAHADTERVTFERALRDAGLLVRQNLVWAKNRLVPGRSDYHYQHEPILYGFAPGGIGRLGRGGDRWYGDDSQTTVFQHDRPGRNKDHPTMKPLPLIQDMLRNSLRPGGTVLDPFGGSGSTLLATHYQGGTARLVEIDPRYVDVICRRYQELTEQQPIRAGVAVDFSPGE